MSSEDNCKEMVIGNIQSWITIVYILAQWMNKISDRINKWNKNIHLKVKEKQPNGKPFNVLPLKGNTIVEKMLKIVIISLWKIVWDFI